MLEGPKTAKRKLKCRVCGHEIGKGEEYWVEKWLEGPYLRRMVVCRNCAANILKQYIAEMVVRSRHAAIEECIRSVAPSPGRNVVETIATIVIMGVDNYVEAKRNWCKRFIEKYGYYVDIDKGLKKLAEKLAINVEDEIKKIDKHAIPRLIQ